MKKQATHWEKISANHRSDKGFTSTMYKELSKQKQTTHLENGQKTKRICNTNKDMHMANMHMIRCSPSLAIR